MPSCAALLWGSRAARRATPPYPRPPAVNAPHAAKPASRPADYRGARPRRLRMRPARMRARTGSKRLFKEEEMSLRIQNNVEAFNAHRQLVATGDKAAKAMERLSS